MPKLLDEIVAIRGDELALADEFGRTTWSELDERTRRLINAFKGASIGPGDTIALMMGNRRECFEIFQAAAHLGVTYVPVNWHWVADELAYVLDDADAKALIVGHRFVEVAEQALSDNRSQGVQLSLALGEGPTEHLNDYEEFISSGNTSDLPADQQLLGGPMFYTSGTTGRPKGVRGALSGGETIPTEVMQLIGSSMASYVPQGGRSLLVGPVYHSAQWAFTFMPMVNGSSVVMRHKFDGAETVKLIDEEKITNIHLVPTQFKRMLDISAEDKESFTGESLEAVWHGAAPCPPPWKKAMLDWFGPKIHEYYGSTEGAFISNILADDWIRKEGSVGKPVETIEVIIIDENGERIEEPNMPGVLYFRNLMGMGFEYHKAPEKTAEAHLEPGVFTTGDIGYLDEEGYLWLSDRKIDMIISGGVNIYPAEIEAVIAEHPGVADVSVIGVPNEEYGEEVKAVVECSDGHQGNDEFSKELLQLCNQKLAGYKRPKSIDFVNQLPRTGTGKILKRKLREPYWEGLERSI
ncbi:MAG: AMP-dependent synthetase [Acidimicrobiaceae bacterium]|nr:AMP-dependent synthetase [Acidimicrobiaceae bacterium]